MYYRSSATVTRNGILQTDSSITGRVNPLISPTKSDKSTRVNSKQLRSQLDEHLSDLRSKERYFFSSSLQNTSYSETPISTFPPPNTAQYQITPNFVNSTNKCTKLEELPDYHIGDCQRTFQQLDFLQYNNTDSNQCKDILFKEYSQTEQQSEPMFLSQLSDCYSPTHSLSPGFELFGAESNERTLTPDTAVSPYAGIFSNEN